MIIILRPRVDAPGDLLVRVELALRPQAVGGVGEGVPGEVLQPAAARTPGRGGGVAGHHQDLHTGGVRRLANTAGISFHLNSSASWQKRQRQLIYVLAFKNASALSPGPDHNCNVTCTTIWRSVRSIFQICSPGSWRCELNFAMSKLCASLQLCLSLYLTFATHVVTSGGCG